MAGPINWLSQVASVTKFGLLSIPQRRGSVSAAVIGIAGVVAVLGGALGLGLAWLITSGGDPTGGMLPQFFFPHADLLVGVAFSLLLGLATGLFPALAAMRLRVADALRRM